MQQGKADALSRRSYLAQHPGVQQVLLGRDRLWPIKTHVFEPPLGSNLLKSIRTDIKDDAFTQDILDHIVESCASSS